MSMLAMFVQVEPVRLAEIIDDPSRVTALFDDDESVGGLSRSPLAQGPLGESLELLQRTPKILAASMAMMDPAMRERLKQRLAADWLMEEFRHLRQFYADASAAKLAIVTNLE